MAKLGKKQQLESPSPGSGELMFNWNGHLWGAYEVLGLEPGADLEDVEAAYQSQIIKLDKHSHGFIKMAYELILSKLQG